MSNEMKSQLSAMMDGELEKDASRFLLRRLASDAELSADWARWHVIRDSMNGRLSGRPDADLAARVAAVLEQDAAHSASWSGKTLRWVSGAAIAASVAVAALITLPTLGTGPASPAPGSTATAVLQSPIAEVQPSGLTERDLRPSSLAPVAQSVSRGSSMSLPPAVQVDPRLDAWLIRHNAALLEPQQDSFVPYIPLASPYRPVAQRVMVDASSADRR